MMEDERTGRKTVERELSPSNNEDMRFRACLGRWVGK
jgi:hypothetical protein